MNYHIAVSGSFTFVDAAQAAAISHASTRAGQSFLHPDDLRLTEREVVVQLARDTNNSELPVGLADLQALGRSAVAGCVEAVVSLTQQCYRVAAGGDVSCQWADRPLLAGAGPVLTRIQHPVSIFAVAVSPGGTYVAVGGGTTALAIIYDQLRDGAAIDNYPRLADVTVWERATGRQVARLRGLQGEVAALAFSRDERHLTGVSASARCCTWELATGVLIREQRRANARGWLTLATGATDPTAEPTLLSTPRKNALTGRVLAPDGRRTVQATFAGMVVRAYPSGKPLATLPFDGLAGGRGVCWLDSAGAVGIVGDDWCGTWLPDPGHLAVAAYAADAAHLHAVAPLPGGTTVLCARGERTLGALTLPHPAGARPVRTAWERAVAQFERAASATAEIRESDWRWLETPDGYEGATIEGDQLVWFSHAHNPHAGGGASVQALDDFLARGPAVTVPPEATQFLPSIYRAARRALAASGQGPP